MNQALNSPANRVAMTEFSRRVRPRQSYLQRCRRRCPKIGRIFQIMFWTCEQAAGKWVVFTKSLYEAWRQTLNHEFISSLSNQHKFWDRIHDIREDDRGQFALGSTTRLSPWYSFGLLGENEGKILLEQYNDNNDVMWLNDDIGYNSHIKKSKLWCLKSGRNNNVEYVLLRGQKWRELESPRA